MKRGEKRKKKKKKKEICTTRREQREIDVEISVILSKSYFRLLFVSCSSLTFSEKRRKRERKGFLSRSSDSGAR